MKAIKDMDLSEKTTWAFGVVLMGMGSGDVRGGLLDVVHTIGRDGFERGVESEKRRVKQQLREKARRKRKRRGKKS